MNFHAIKAIYRFEMARMFRTVVQSIVAPVLSTSLYFVIFGAAIGSRITEIERCRENGCNDTLHNGPNMRAISKRYMALMA